MTPQNVADCALTSKILCNALHTYTHIFLMHGYGMPRMPQTRTCHVIISSVQNGNISSMLQKANEHKPDFLDSFEIVWHVVQCGRDSGIFTTKHWSMSQVEFQNSQSILSGYSQTITAVLEWHLLNPLFLRHWQMSSGAIFWYLLLGERIDITTFWWIV